MNDINFNQNEFLKSLMRMPMLIIFSCVFMMLTACSSKAIQGETVGNPVELEFWNVFTGPDGDTMQKIVEDFNEEYEGKINITTRVIASEDYYTTLLSTMIGGIAPDVCILHCSRIAYFADKNLLYSLENTIGELGFSENDFIQVAWEVGEYDGVRYGIPIDVHPLGLYYNKSLLNEKGFNEPPTDLQSFLEIAQACTYDSDNDGKVDVWGFALDPNVMLEQIYWSVLYQFGGEAFTEDKTASAYNSKEGVDALQLLYDMIYTYKISQKDLLPDSAITMFEEGNLALYSNGPWIISELNRYNNLDYGIATFPQMGEEKGVWADSHNIAIPKQRNISSTKLKAIQTFMNYVLDHEMEWAKAGHVPVLKEILESDEFNKLTQMKPFAEQLDYVQIPWGSPYYTDIWVPIQEHLPEVLLNKMSPQNMLINAQMEAESRIKIR